MCLEVIIVCEFKKKKTHLLDDEYTEVRQSLREAQHRPAVNTFCPSHVNLIMR